MTIFDFLELFIACWKTYSNNRSKNSKIGKRVLDVLQVNLTSPEGATALLPAWVLSTESLGEVLGIANWVLAEKRMLVTLNHHRLRVLSSSSAILSS